MAFVPQGLPATVTMLLTFAAMRLKDANVLVKDLTAVDTLGTITLLASDKTGTLTINRMTVVDMWINGNLVSTETEVCSGNVERGGGRGDGSASKVLFISQLNVRCCYNTIFSRFPVHDKCWCSTDAHAERASLPPRFVRSFVRSSVLVFVICESTKM